MSNLVNKLNVAYLYNEIEFGNKKEWSIDLCDNMNELWKHYKKPVVKDHKLCDFTYDPMRFLSMKCTRQPIKAESRSELTCGQEGMGELEVI